MGKSKNSEKKIILSPGISKKQKLARGKYISKRMELLFADISDWLKNTDFKIKKIFVSIESIKVPSVEIYFNTKLLAELKPAGLWGFGVNLQVNIISENGTDFIFDMGSESSKPDWKLISGKPVKEPKDLNKIIFRNFLRKISK